ncbi:MAG TPA: ECF-type sigma factor [Blastocatellia bacterium]
MSDSVGDVTRLLIRYSNGETDVLQELVPAVYDELHRLARGYLRRERPNHTLEPGALVNEAYLRIVRQEGASWQNRAQFFGMAAKIMRNILVDCARERHAAKRGGQMFRVSLTKADRISGDPDIDMLGLDKALDQLAEANSLHARIVELRFFGNLTVKETSEVLGVSETSVERGWRFARAWLRKTLKESGAVAP